MESLQAKQSFVITPPRSSSSASGASVGEVVTFAVSSSAGYIQLDSLLQQTVTPMTPTQQKSGVTSNDITIAAETATLYIIFGPTAASVSGAHPPVVPTVVTGIGTLSSGAYTRATGTAWPIPAGTAQRFYLQSGVDKFMGFVASGNGYAALYQSSAPSP